MQIKSADTAVQKWLEEQMTPGISADSNAIVMSTEVRRLMADTAYRDSVYRQPYTFTDVGHSLAATNLRRAFWQMINLYPQNKQRVLRYIVAYDELIDSDRLVASSFYTYALLDPRITKIDGGKPAIIHPDVMDSLFRNMNEIIDYILQYRVTHPQKKK